MKASELRPGQYFTFVLCLTRYRRVQHESRCVYYIDEKCQLHWCAPDLEVAAVAGWDDEPKKDDPLNGTPFWLFHAMAVKLSDVDCTGDDPTLRCSQTELCITEWCTPCAAYAWLKSHDKRCDPAPSTPEPCKCDSPKEFAYNVSTGPIPQGSACIVNMETGEKRIVPYDEAFPSTPEPFKVGDLVVWLNRSDDPEKAGSPEYVDLVRDKVYPIDKVRDDGLVVVDGDSHYAHRFRHATAAEIEQYKAEQEPTPPPLPDGYTFISGLTAKRGDLCYSKPTHKYAVSEWMPLAHDGGEDVADEWDKNYWLCTKVPTPVSEPVELAEMLAEVEAVSEGNHNRSAKVANAIASSLDDLASVLRSSGTEYAVAQTDGEFYIESVPDPDEPKRQDDEGWIEHDGKSMPAIPDHSCTIMQFSDGSQEPTYTPQLWRWIHTGRQDDITHYRVVEQPPAKYRPFASAEEFKPHCRRLLRSTSVANHYLLPWWLNDYGCARDGMTYAELFEQFVFDDSGEPCGVRE